MSNNSYIEFGESPSPEGSSPESFETEKTAVYTREDLYQDPSSEPTQILSTFPSAAASQTTKIDLLSSNLEANNIKDNKANEHKTRQSISGAFLLPIISLIALGICGYTLFFVLPESAKEITVLYLIQAGITAKLILPITVTVVSAILGLAAALASVIFRSTRWFGIILVGLSLIGLSLGIPYSIFQMRNNTYTAVKQSINDKQIQKDLIEKAKDTVKETTEKRLDIFTTELQDFQEKDIPILLHRLDTLAKATGTKTRELYLKIPETEREKIPKEIREVIEKKLGLK